MVLYNPMLLTGAMAVVGTGLFDVWSLKDWNLLHGNIPRCMLGIINVALRPHFGIGIQESARYNPKFLISTQLWHGGATFPTEATAKPRILLGVHESPDEILPTRP